jgi:hypothetical protein
MPKEIGTRELANRALAAQTREDKNRRLAVDVADLRRKERAAVKSAKIGAELIERIEKAKLKRGKSRKKK